MPMTIQRTIHIRQASHWREEHATSERIILGTRVTYVGPSKVTRCSVVRLKDGRHVRVNDASLERTR